MKRRIVICAALGLVVSAAWAGVKVEWSVKVADSPGDTGTETFRAQGEMTRTDFGAAGGENQSVIFRDQAMFFVNHDKKMCQTIDKRGLDELSGQLDAMMKQMESIPPEQRAMMEKMMKGKAPGGKKPPVRRVETGGSEQIGDYTCILHTLYSDEEKVEEVCLADAAVGDDIHEAMGAFRALAQFTEGLMDLARNMPFGKMLEVPYQEVHEKDGFPVRTRSFDGEGKLVRERTLTSVTRQDIDAAVFAVPKGYKVKHLQKEMKKRR